MGPRTDGVGVAVGLGLVVSVVGSGLVVERRPWRTRSMWPRAVAMATGGLRETIGPSKPRTLTQPIRMAWRKVGRVGDPKQRWLYVTKVASLTLRIDESRDGCRGCRICPSGDCGSVVVGCSKESGDDGFVLDCRKLTLSTSSTSSAANGFGLEKNMVGGGDSVLSWGLELLSNTEGGRCGRAIVPRGVG